MTKESEIQRLQSNLKLELRAMEHYATNQFWSDAFDIYEHVKLTLKKLQIAHGQPEKGTE